jgi:RHH-type proline utilization regulon transcriptional repressor/proline dehydrogenase/delta 1-pyrroline-5-carboxylate dehydrogenase
MIFARVPALPDPLRAAIRAAYLADETETIDALLAEGTCDANAQARIQSRARDLVARVRARRHGLGGIDAFLHEYGLDTQEGVVLMCLAEALLRIPDAATADRLIQDRLGSAQWAQHLGRSDSLFVNASTWGLMLSGKLLRLDVPAPHDVPSYLGRLIARVGEPALRLALREAMTILGRQFVMGRDIDAALARSRSAAHRDFRYSFDMLGEAALTALDAQRYFEAYRRAIAAVGASGANARNVFVAAGVSVKLSALHPRFEFAQHERLMRELVPRVLALAEAARTAGIGLTLDAEESERLEPTLDVFEAVYRALGASNGGDYEGFGIAVQAYQKRARPTIDWLIALAQSHRRRIPVRLVKGAYWDSEIKRAQERGLAEYPVFTRKAATDVCYLACARRLLGAGAALYPQFATHNAHTIATILELASATSEFEFQRLHGMGEALYTALIMEGIEAHHPALACRVYAPVGSHEDLLPYLVRRLLENGANTSFLHHVLNESVPVETLVADPAARLARPPRAPIARPRDLYGAWRNSRGVNLHDVEELSVLAREMERALAQPPTAAALVAGRAVTGATRPVLDPADRRRIVGQVIEAEAAAVDAAMDAAAAAQPAWDATPAGERAAILERAADLIERDRGLLAALLVREGGKCVPDADAEVREAADYCRYYAQRAREDFARPLALPGPTGEANELQLHGRGVFACISPWNFPLAIFTGQVTAALAAGNGVLAKPSRQTPLVAHAAVRLLHEAGIPPALLHYLPGASSALAAPLLEHPRLAGVAFTGSTDAAHSIQQRLAARPGPIATLIAETGGVNAMIVDSSALPEQVVTDALRSAFNSAGQRCSALRVLFVQQDITTRVLELIEGAVAELGLGDPALLATDVGPVIEDAARATLEQHAQRMQREAKLLCRAPLPRGTEHGSFFAPCVFEIDSLAQLPCEVFGPILHVVRYRAEKLDEVIDAINRSGYGLTLGIHTRIETTARYIQNRARVGNTYVNRNQIGAVVGVQPFGGEGLSGTGPKAGGPRYLPRFATERTLSINTAAIGGNASLLSQDDSDDSGNH